MADLGCDLGGMVFYALSRGVSAVGIDGDPSVASGRSTFNVVTERDVRAAWQGRIICLIGAGCEQGGKSCLSHRTYMPTGRFR